MTRLARSLALLATVGLLAACGKADPSTSTAKRASTASRAERARALGLARAINLTAADVPGFHASSKQKEHESPSEKRLKRKLAACVHPVTAAPVAEAGSPNFKRESGLASASVQSEVTVASSAAVAAKELSLVRSPRTRQCVSRYIQLIVRAKTHPGASFGAVSVVQRTPPAPGADGSFAWRISMPIKARGITLGIYFDIFGFVSGPNEVTLFVSGVPIPPPARAEEQLFSLLLERTKAGGKGHPASPAGPNPNATSS
jgi:hypothetical protein